MYDEILEAEAREQLLDQGIDEDSVDFIIADMREDGMFDIPEGY